MMCFVIANAMVLTPGLLLKGFTMETCKLISQTKTKLTKSSDIKQFLNEVKYDMKNMQRMRVLSAEAIAKADTCVALFEICLTSYMIRKLNSI